MSALLVRLFWGLNRTHVLGTWWTNRIDSSYYCYRWFWYFSILTCNVKTKSLKTRDPSVMFLFPLTWGLTVFTSPQAYRPCEHPRSLTKQVDDLSMDRFFLRNRSLFFFFFFPSYWKPWVNDSIALFKSLQQLYKAWDFPPCFGYTLSVNWPGDGIETKEYCPAVISEGISVAS